MVENSKLIQLCAQSRTTTKTHSSGGRNSLAGKALALHTTGKGLIPNTSYETTSGVILEQKEWSKPLSIARYDPKTKKFIPYSFIPCSAKLCSASLSNITEALQQE